MSVFPTVEIVTLCSEWVTLLTLGYPVVLPFARKTALERSDTFFESRKSFLLASLPNHKFSVLCILTVTFYIVILDRHFKSLLSFIISPHLCLQTWLLFYVYLILYCIFQFWSSGSMQYSLDRDFAWPCGSKGSTGGNIPEQKKRNSNWSRQTEDILKW
jgi:hypothetical protein